MLLEFLSRPFPNPDWKRLQVEKESKADAFPNADSSMNASALGTVRRRTSLVLILVKSAKVAFPTVAALPIPRAKSLSPVIFARALLRIGPRSKVRTAFLLSVQSEWTSAVRFGSI